MYIERIYYEELIHYEALAHVIENSNDLLSTSWRPRETGGMIQPEFEAWEPEEKMV